MCRRLADVGRLRVYGHRQHQRGGQRQHAALRREAVSSSLPLRRSLSPFFVPRILNNLPASNISIRFGFTGPCVSNNMACASSAYSLLEALRALRGGDCAMALAGGSESCLGRMAYAGFGSMHALCTRFNAQPQRGSRPFDRRRGGFVMGEGAGRLALPFSRSRPRSRNPAKRPRARRARVDIRNRVDLGPSWDGELVDGASNCDGFHVTSPTPDGAGARAFHRVEKMTGSCMERLLRRSGVPREAVGYINAHATSTQIGDRAEMLAISSVFAGCQESAVISSTKGATGHLLGAAGALEAGVCVWGLHEVIQGVASEE